MNGYPTQPQPPAKRSPWKTCGILAGGFILFGLLFMVGCSALFVHSANKVSKDPEANAPKKVVAFNTPAEDGKFTFRVIKMEHTDHIGDSIVGSDAQGEYLVVTVTVFNHGSKAQMLNASDQKLIADGKTYDADSGVFTDNEAFLNNINPGNSVTANLAFDVPQGTQGDQLVLHDSPFSNGVRCALR